VFEERGGSRTGRKRGRDLVGEVGALRAFRRQLNDHLVAATRASRTHIGLSVNAHRLPLGATVPRIRLPSIVPPTRCSASAPHTAPGSNETTITARPPGPAATGHGTAGCAQSCWWHDDDRADIKP
jgi:hypothetical protein